MFSRESLQNISLLYMQTYMIQCIVLIIEIKKHYTLCIYFIKFNLELFMSADICTLQMALWLQITYLTVSLWSKLKRFWKEILEIFITFQISIKSFQFDLFKNMHEKTLKIDLSRIKMEMSVHWIYNVNPFHSFFRVWPDNACCLLLPLI